jgi:hypothetical protein
MLNQYRDGALRHIIYSRLFPSAVGIQDGLTEFRTTASYPMRFTDGFPLAEKQTHPLGFRML